MAIAILPSERNPDRLVRSQIELIQGRSNSVVQVTLTANAGSTVVSFANCSLDCAPLFTPLTAHAAAEIGNGTMWISTISNGSFVIDRKSVV